MTELMLGLVVRELGVFRCPDLGCEGSVGLDPILAPDPMGATRMIRHIPHAEKAAAQP